MASIRVLPAVRAQDLRLGTSGQHAAVSLSAARSHLYPAVGHAIIGPLALQTALVDLQRGTAGVLDRPSGDPPLRGPLRGERRFRSDRGHDGGP